MKRENPVLFLYLPKKIVLEAKIVSGDSLKVKYEDGVIQLEKL